MVFIHYTDDCNEETDLLLHTEPLTSPDTSTNTDNDPDKFTIKDWNPVNDNKATLYVDSITKAKIFLHCMVDDYNYALTPTLHVTDTIVCTSHESNSKCAQAAQHVTVDISSDLYNYFHIGGMCNVTMTIITSADVEKTSPNAYIVPDDNQVKLCDIKGSFTDNPLDLDKNNRTIAFSFASITNNRRDNAKHKELDDTFIFQLNSLLHSDDTENKTCLEYPFVPVFKILSSAHFDDPFPHEQNG